MIGTRRKYPERLKRICFRLKAGEWHGFKTESLWGEQVAGGKFRIENSPFFAKGISFEDIVIASEDNGELFFERVVVSGGRSTYRVIPSQTTTEDIFLEFWAPLQKLGCSFESADFGYRIYSIDVPTSTDIYEVYRLLEEGEKNGVWGFEEGHCGHLQRI